MTTDPTEEPPAAVPARATRDGEVPARWSWTERTVWTARMVTALETGVKGGRWYSLMDKVYAPATLRAAFERVKANRGAAGVDHVTVETYAQALGANLTALAEAHERPQSGGDHRGGQPEAARMV